jgi:CheY-like chemotaxis protein
MLRDFIAVHREQILARTSQREAERSPSLTTPPEPPTELRAFLDQLGEDLRRTSAREAIDHSELAENASQHGHNLFDEGKSRAQVVYAYGDFCQVISGLAVEKGVSIPASELQTLGLCLDAAIAGALTEHGRRGERAIRDGGVERLRALAAETHRQLMKLVSAIEPAPDVVPRADDKAATSQGARETLCVVDRDPHVRRLVQQFIGESYVVDFFDDGQSALDTVRRSAPSALVTEILIPGLDGLALCRLIKGDPVTQGIPILVSSMLAAEERARQSGADAFLEKPLEKKRFVASLRGLTQPRGRAPEPLRFQGAA